MVFHVCWNAIICMRVAFGSWGLPVPAGAAFAAFGAAITIPAHSVANATLMPAVRRNAVCMC
ncbi:hypothetical protein [Bifidobacterium animalis]|uniref:hypothetical protein n=1 Tax=Bifidobacterium animalis TaxID=28025 RepID=UPI001E518CCC|nr:hypothetical protein [Bifidobacterium animalis]UQE63166.1 hypothetical protein M2855_07210 [Bifidobacterium animalis]